MANRRGYYYGQQVTSAELQAGYDNLEAADRNQFADMALSGVASGGIVTQHAPTADLTVDVTALIAYDPSGERVQFPSTQTQSLATDSNNVSTAVITSGNSKIVSLFAQFKRANSDPRTDLNGATVNFVQDESFQFVVVQGAEAVSPSPPALLANAILLADITRAFGQTQILNANISTSRRQDMFVTVGLSPRNLRRGLFKDAFADILGWYDSHVTGTADRHTGAMVDLSGMPSWAGGSSGITNPNTDVQTQVIKILTDLSSTTAGASGADRLGVAARGAWLDGTTNNAQTIFGAINKIITDLAGNSSPVTNGASKIGFLSTGSLTSHDVSDALQEIDGGWGKLARANTWTAMQSLNGGVQIPGTSDYGYSPAKTTSRWQQGGLFNTTAATFATQSISVGVGQLCDQGLDLPDGATLTEVLVAVHPVNATPPTGNTSAIFVLKTDMTTGVATSLGFAHDTTAGAGYGAYHTFALTGLTEVVDRTRYKYTAELQGETGTGAAAVTYFGAQSFVTLSRVDPNG